MQNKLIRHSISTIIVVLGIIWLFYGFSVSNQERIIKQNEMYLKSIAVHSANQLDNSLEAALIEIKAYANFYSKMIDGESIKSEDLLTVEKDSHFDYIRFTNAQGLNITSNNETSDARDRDYYLEAMKGNSGISIIDKSRITNETLVNFYTPVIKNDEIIGVLRGVYLTDSQMKNLLDTTYFNKKISTIVIDDKGMIIAANIEDNIISVNIGSQLISNQIFDDKALAIINDCISNNKSANFSFIADGQKTLGYIAKMETNNWYLVQIFPTEITNNMYKEVISLGFKLEISLILLFIMYLLYQQYVYHITKKRLLEENRDMNYIIKGTPKLYDSIILVDLVEKKYRYLIASNDKLSDKGDYALLIEYIANSAALDIISKQLSVKLNVEYIKQHLNDSILEFEIVYQIKNKENWNRLNIIPIEKNNSEITKVIIAQRDITDIKNQEIKKNSLLQEAIKKANIANRSKNTFLFNMSHDIRTPINAIMGFTHLIKEHINDKELVLNYLEKIEKSSDVLCHIIDDILDLAKIENGQTQLDVKNTNLYEVSNMIKEMFDDSMKLKNINFETNFDFRDPYVIVDVNKLNQIIINLLSNAQKFTLENGEIYFSFKQVSDVIDNQVMYELYIKDNGIGISEEFLPKIFNAFERERNTTSSKIQGTGLGLSIVKHFVDIMNGQISVKSTVGKGTEFTVNFIFDIIESFKKDEISIDEDFLVGKRILVAEDNELNQEIVLDILTNKGCIVELANDGLQAYEMVKNASKDYYDFILMDIQMPNLNGYEATSKIRMLDNDNKDIIIIAMSANAFVEDKDKAYQFGMNGFISKPINVKEMLLMFEELRK